MVGCMPSAKSTEFDIWANYPFVYNEDAPISKEFPPLVLEEGESYPIYIGTSTKNKKRKGHTIIFVGERTFPIKGKLQVWNGTKIYIIVANEGNQFYDYYLVIKGQKYVMENGNI
jgi:hypothetical protein